MTQHIEIAPEQAHEAPLSVDAISARLAELKSKKDEKEMTKEEYKKNLDEIRVQIEQPETLQNASVEEMTRLRAELQSLTAEVDSAQPEAPNVAQDSVNEVKETWYKPQTWSPETKQAAGWGLGLGVGVVGLMVLWRATKNTAKEYAAATGEKVGWLWNKVKWVAALAVTAGLGYVGIRVFQDYKKLAALQNRLETLVKTLPTLTGEKRLAAEQEIHEIQREIRNIKDGVAAKESDKNTAADEAQRKAQETAEAARENARKMAENPAAQESVEEAKKYTLVRGMLLFEPAQATWAAASEDTKHAQLTDTIHENADRPIDEILAARTPPFTIKEGAGDLPSRQQASLYLWKFCKNHRSTAEKYKPKDGEGEMTLERFLKKVAQSYVAADLVNKTIRNAGGNIFEAIHNFDTTKVITSDAMGEATKEYIEEAMVGTGMSEEEMQQLNWAQLLEIFTSTTGTIAGNTRIDEGTTVSKVLLKLQEKLKDKDLTDVDNYMLPFFHRRLPRAEWDSQNYKKNEAKVHEYLISKMPMNQALRCAFYTHLIKKGDPAGIMLMQAEILKYVATEEPSILSMDKQFVVSRIGETMLELSTGKISDEWKALNIDPVTLEKGLGVLKGALEKGAETAIEAAGAATWEVGKLPLALASDHKGLVAAVGTTLVAGATAYGQHRLDAHRLVEALDASTKRVRLQNWYRSTDLLTRRLGAHEAMKRIVDLVSLNTDLGKRASAMQALDKFVKGTRSMKSLTDLSIELTKILPYTNELGESLEKLKLHQKTLRNFRLPIRAASLAHRIPMGLAKPLKFLGKGLPVAAAIYEGVAYEWFGGKEALQEQFDAEKDPLKRKIIRNEMLANRENWMLSLASSPLAFTNPFGATIFFGNMARQHANDSINAGTREMLEDRRDWMDKTPGELLHKVQKAAPGATLTYGHWLAKTQIVDAATLVVNNINPIAPYLLSSSSPSSSNNPLSMGETFDAANTSIRSEAYATYFKQNAFLPPVSADMLTEEEAMDPAVSEKRLHILNEDQANCFTQSALNYLSHVTNQTFVTVDAEILHRAIVYAHRCSLDWRLQMLGQETTFTKQDWAEKDAAITEGISHETDEMIATANAHIESGEKAQNVLPFFFMESIKDDLAVCEANILSTNYSDWGIPFYNSSNHEEMQNIARTMFAEKIEAKLNTICASTQPLTKESFESGRESLLTALKANPDTLAIEGFNRENQTALIEIGADPALLSVDGILGYLQTYTEAPDPTLDT